MENPTSLPIALLICSDVAKISFIKKTLKGGYYVMDSRDSLSGFEWMKSTPIEIIILDYKTIDEPLFNLCQHIRKIPGYKTTPILLITNKIQKSFTVEALSAGVSDFIHEPLEAKEIYERVAVCLKSKMVNKKMTFVTNKIKNSPLIPKDTQLFLNRLLLNDQTLKEISEAKKVATPLSLLMIQLDSYAMIEKTWGGAVMGEILEGVNQFLKKKLRQFDTLISQGGGRFLILLPKTSQSAAKIIGGDIQKEICRTTLSTKKKEFLVTLSIEVVCFDKKLSDAAQAYEQFDHSLGRIKKALDKSQKKGNKPVSE